MANASPPVIVQRPHPEGATGLRLSADEMAARIARDMRDPEVMKWARRTVAEANLDGIRGRPEPTPIVQCLFAAIKKIVTFVKDPLGTELMYASRHLLCLDEYCVRGGDCDDQIIVLGAASMSVGIPIRLRVRTYKGQALGHVTMLYDSNRKLGGPWIGIDPSTESGACSNAPYVDEFTIDVNPEGGLMFIGVGDPPDGDLGDAPALLPPDQAAAWAAQVTIGRDALDASRARLRAMTAAYAAVRSDLGLPPYDTLPAGELAPSGSALNAYAQSGLWTSQAATDESKLLASADFISQCLSDGLSGARTLTFDQGDVYVGMLAGDPYRVLMQVPAAGGAAVPTVLDAQGAVQGTLGFIQFIVGAAVLAVVSLAAAYAVDKLCDYLAQKHHDDALGKVADNQAQLVASGKETPEQAAAQVRAMSELATASTLPKDNPFLSGWTGLLASAALGVALGVGADRVLDRLLRARQAA